MLPAYYNHVRAFENTLVTKFFGLHCVKLTGATQKKVRRHLTVVIIIFLTFLFFLGRKNPTHKL